MVLFVIVISGMVSCKPVITTNEKHLVFIGLDGWGGYGFEESLSHMPHVRQYTRLGVYTYKKTAVSPTSSGSNWASIFMGTMPSVHGYLKWDSKMPSEPYPFEVNNNIFPTISQVLRQEKPSSEIGMFCQWDGIKFLVDTLSINYYRHIPLTESCNHFAFTDSVSLYLKSYKPLLLTIVFDDPDHTGHKKQFFSDEYYSILEELDKCIGRIVFSVKKAGIYDNTVFIITSDHGGKGYNHGGNSIEERLTCFVMWGQGVKQEGFVDDSLDQQDIAPIMADILNINVHEKWTGKSHHNYFKTN